jgi:hypothetical protein
MGYDLVYMTVPYHVVCSSGSALVQVNYGDEQMYYFVITRVQSVYMGVAVTTLFVNSIRFRFDYDY